MKIVVDTNVIFSAIFFQGIPSKILDKILNGHHEIVLSEEIVGEYKNVIIRYCEKKKAHDLPVALDFLNTLISEALLVNANNVITPPCADPDDIKFLQAAIAANAKYLISGDGHLLEVGDYPGGKVLKPQQFLNLEQTRS